MRADRQPEFTQLDLEMSFPRQQDIFEVIEHVMERACAVVGVQAKGPFRHLDYKDALRRYGSDKPDLRFGMELQNVTQFFEPARETLHIEGNVQAVVAPGAAVMVAQTARRACRIREIGGRARRLHRESHGGRDHVGAREKSRRGRAEEIGGDGRAQSPAI